MYKQQKFELSNDMCLIISEQKSVVDVHEVVDGGIPALRHIFMRKL
jgi:hypothetical protein